MKSLHNATKHAHGMNLTSGDRFSVYANNHRGVIQDISFDGRCCSITKAFASLVTEELREKSLKEGKNLRRKVKWLIQSKSKTDGLFKILINQLSKLSPRNSNKESFIYVLLPWNTTVKAIRMEENNTSQKQRNFSLYID